MFLHVRANAGANWAHAYDCRRVVSGRHGLRAVAQRVRETGLLSLSSCRMCRYGSGARYDGKFADAPVIGSCDGHDNVYRCQDKQESCEFMILSARCSDVYTPEYKEFLKQFAE